MKIRTFSVIAVAVMLVSLLAVSAMAAGQERGNGTNAFIDVNGDGVCDNFIDEDGDGINDNSLGNQYRHGHGNAHGNGDMMQERKMDGSCTL